MAGSGVVDMYVTNTAGCAAGGSWETFAGTKNWTLGQTNATATVYVKFRSASSTETACINDVIVHDTIAPTSPSLTISSGATYASTTAVTLALAASGSPQEMYITDTANCGAGGTWEAFAATKAWTLPSTNAANDISVKFRDAIGNQSTCDTASITHDNQAPTAPAFTSTTPASPAASRPARGDRYCLCGHHDCIAL